MLLTPKNWPSFQHYRKRNPPWIKLHRSLLDDFDFAQLPAESRALAPMLWLLASESLAGCFQGASDSLAFRLRISAAEVEKALKPLIDKGFFILASDPLAECLQGATPETETETETPSQGGSVPMLEQRQGGLAPPPPLGQGSAAAPPSPEGV